MGCEVSADANQGIKKIPNPELERAPPSPMKSTRQVVIQPKIIQNPDPLSKAKLLQAEKNFAEALKFYSEAYQNDPNNKEIAHSLLRCSRTFSTNEEIIKHLLLCHRLDQQNQSLCLQLAERYEQSSDIQKAILYYKKIVDLHPQQQKYELQFAGFLLRNKRYEESILSYRKILARNPENVDILQKLFSIYNVTEQYNEQLKCLDLLLKNSPNEEQYLLESGLVYKNKLHQYEKSIPYFEKLSEKQPNSNLYHRYLAQCYLKTNQILEAEASYLKAIEIDETDCLAHLGLGDIRFTQQKYHEAIESYLKGMENEHEETSYVGVGKCYFMLTQHEESIDCLKKAIEKNSKNPTTYLYLAKNYKALQKKLWCQKWLQKCLDIDQKHEQARLMLEALKQPQKV